MGLLLSARPASYVAPGYWVAGYAEFDEVVAGPTTSTGDLAATEAGSDSAAITGQLIVQGDLTVSETGLTVALSAVGSTRR